MSSKGKNTALPLTRGRFIFVVFVLIVLGIIFLPAFKQQLDTIKNRFSTAPSPTPFKYSKYVIPAPLPTGKQVYNVSRGSGSTGPNIERITIDPFDPKKGQTQTYSIKISNNAPVTKVILTVTTDYQATPYEATLKEGKSTAGVWEAVVPATDSRDYVYRAMIEAADAKEKASITLTVR